MQIFYECGKKERHAFMFVHKKGAYLDVFCTNVNATDECTHLIDGPRVDFIGLGLTSPLTVHGQ